MFEYRQLNMFKERNLACLTQGSYAGCHTRWRDLESHLLPYMIVSKWVPGLMTLALLYDKP